MAVLTDYKLAVLEVYDNGGYEAVGCATGRHEAPNIEETERVNACTEGKPEVVTTSVTYTVTGDGHLDSSMFTIAELRAMNGQTKTFKVDDGDSGSEYFKGRILFEFDHPVSVEEESTYSYTIDQIASFTDTDPEGDG